MPVPKPKEGEEKQEYVSRCIAYLTREKEDEYPKKEQRAAICYSEWNSYQKKHGHPEKAEKGRPAT